MGDNSASWFDQLGGVKLWSPSTGQTDEAKDVLSNKLILLYFSAHWCGPCRRFTPQLIQTYQALKARQEEPAEPFELIFCSMDRTQEKYDEYTSNMPWWCLPFDSCSTLVQVLAHRFGAVGIPHLVVLGKDRTVLVKDGVGEVSVDPEARNFPWRPRPIVELFPSHYLVKTGSATKESRIMSELDDMYLLVYVSASWCPPCQRFTPKLVKAYETLNDWRSDFELIFVSADHTEAEFEEYYSDMPFAALPYEDREAKTNLTKRLDVQGIPSLIMLGPVESDTGDRSIVNSNVRAVIETGDYISDFPYHPKPYGDLNKTTENINDFRCLIVFHEGGDDDEQEDVVEAVQMAAKVYNKKDIKFYWALEPTKLSKTVRKAVGIEDVSDKLCMVLLDIPDRGAYYISNDTDIGLDTILGFLLAPGERREIQ